MNPHSVLLRRVVPGVVLALLCLTASGCNRDPKAQRAKFLESAREFSAKGEHSKALLQLQNAIRLDREVADTYYLLAKEHEALKQFAEAFKSLMLCVRKDPNHRKARLLLGDIFIELRRYPDALEQAQVLLEKNPKDVEALLVVASAYRRDGKFENAAAALNSAISADPKNTRALREMAALRMQDKDAEGAEALLKQVAEIGGNKLEAVLPLVELYLRTKRPEQAIGLCEDAVRKEPNSSDALAKLGQVYVLAGKADQAEETFKRIKNLPGGGPTNQSALGDFYLTTGQLEKARLEFDGLHKAQPKEIAFSRRLALILLNLGRDSEAEQVLNDLLKQNSDTQGLLFRARLRLKQKRITEAMADLTQAQHQEPASAMVHFEMALAFLAQGNIPRARSSLGDALKYDPRMTSASIMLAQLELTRGSAQGAKNLAEKILKDNPRSLAPYLLHASALLKMRDYAAAEKELTLLQKALPKDAVKAQATILAGLAEAREGQRDFAGSRRLLQQSMQGLDQQPIQLVAELTTTYLHEGKPQQAVDLLQGKLKEQPDNADYAALLGDLLVELHRYKEAEPVLSKALAQRPNDIKVASHLAFVYTQKGRTQDADQILSRLRKQFPDNKAVHIQSAAFYLRTNNRALALQEFEQAYKLDSADPMVANNLAWLYLGAPQGNIDVALKLAQQAHEKVPNSMEYSHTLAVILTKKNSFLQAISLLQECLRQQPNRGEFLYAMGMAQLGKGDKVAAQQYLERSLKGGKNFEGADQAAKQLAELSGR